MSTALDLMSLNLTAGMDVQAVGMGFCAALVVRAFDVCCRLIAGFLSSSLGQHREDD